MHVCDVEDGKRECSPEKKKKRESGGAVSETELWRPTRGEEEETPRNRVPY